MGLQKGIWVGWTQHLPGATKLSNETSAVYMGEEIKENVQIKKAELML